MCEHAEPGPSDVYMHVGCMSMQDADKQRPYYGRVLGAWVHFSRITTPGRPDGLDVRRG